MGLTIALPRERREHERRVALVPAAVNRLLADWPTLRVRMEAGSGRPAGFLDGDYEGVELASDYAATVAGADIVVKVGVPTIREIGRLARGTVLVTLTRAFQHLDEIEALATAGVTTVGMDLVPRTARARSLDAVSSQATVAGYKAALMAAQLSPRLFPMMTTAAGTIRPSRVVVIGAGVAGLQAIATARRLGAEVEAYDIRSRARERIESLGARMIDTGVEATDAAGFARPLRRDEQKRQHDVLAERLSRAHAVICAASIPGRPAPTIVTTDMVDGMLPDTVIVDMAAATGGNCELTLPGEHVQHGDTLIAGPLNLPSDGAVHASEMYARNLSNMLALLIDAEGELHLNENDDIVARCVLTHDGDVCHATTAAMMNRPHRAFGAERAAIADDESEAVSDWVDQHDRTGADTGADTGDSPPRGDADASKGPSNHPETPADQVPVKAAEQQDEVSREDHAASANTARHGSDETGSAVADPAISPLPGSGATADATASPDTAAIDTPEARDDLTVIAGIGPALQGRLYAFGIHTLAMLAELDGPSRERLAVQLELDDEIESADWCGQARALLGLPPREPDDLPVEDEVPHLPDESGDATDNAGDAK